ncbi:MAG: hypothetical protein ABI183_11775 [Polyangiaceae bacterium]
MIGGLVSLTAGLTLAACSSDDSNPAGAQTSGDDGGSSTGDGGGSTTGDGGGKTGDGGTTTGDGGTVTGTAPGLQPDAGSACKVFPDDNPWNTDVSDPAKFPTDPHSDNYISFIQGSGTTKVHPDFGSDATYGIPYIIVPGTQPKIACTFDEPGESDPGPYPIPLNAPIEDGDMHVLAVDKDNCKLYEMYNAVAGGSSWHAYSGALFDLTSNALRPEGYTSGDAAGLPIYPGLAKKWEADSGAIHHALRVTMASSAHSYVHPAVHSAGNSTNAYAPPMGMRLRLKSSVSLSAFTGDALVIATALQHYGLLMADNAGAGNNWYISGETNTSWDDDVIGQLKGISGTDFEVITVGTTTPGD